MVVLSDVANSKISDRAKIQNLSDLVFFFKKLKHVIPSLFSNNFISGVKIIFLEKTMHFYCTGNVSIFVYQWIGHE